MSTVLYYFSGTGNCLKVARDLAKELGEDTRVINIAHVLNSSLELFAERIGIIYPVYVFGMPLIVSRFIRRMKCAADKYVFAVATCAALPADSLGQTQRELQRQGVRLASAFSIRMPGNYIPFYGAIPEQKQRRLFRLEEKRVKEIAAAVRAKRRLPPERNNPLVNFILSGMVYRLAAERIPDMDSRFWADMKCGGCGTCVKVCPARNIILSDGKPKWLHRCEQCMACLQWCPRQSIQYGTETVKRRRYHNPAVRLEDMF